MLIALAGCGDPKPEPGAERITTPEVTQGIQTATNKIRLIAFKQTLVRDYVAGRPYQGGVPPHIVNTIKGPRSPATSLHTAWNRRGSRSAGMAGHGHWISCWLSVSSARSNGRTREDMRGGLATRPPDGR